MGIRRPLSSYRRRARFWVPRLNVTVVSLFGLAALHVYASPVPAQETVITPEMLKKQLGDDYFGDEPATDDFAEPDPLSDNFDDFDPFAEPEKVSIPDPKPLIQEAAPKEEEKKAEPQEEPKSAEVPAAEPPVAATEKETTTAPAQPKESESLPDFDFENLPEVSAPTLPAATPSPTPPEAPPAPEPDTATAPAAPSPDSKFSAPATPPQKEEKQEEKQEEKPALTAEPAEKPKEDKPVSYDDLESIPDFDLEDLPDLAEPTAPAQKQPEEPVKEDAPVAQPAPAEQKAAAPEEEPLMDEEAEIPEPKPVAKPLVIKDKKLPEAVVDMRREGGGPQLKDDDHILLQNLPEGISSAPDNASDRPKGPISIDHTTESSSFTQEEGLAEDERNIGISVRKSQDTETTETLLNDAYQALVFDQVESAIALYKKVLEDEPEHQLGLFGLATAYQRNMQVAQARETYATLLKRYPTYQDALNNYLALLSDQSPDEALVQLNQLAEKNPDFSPVQAQIGMIFMKKGDYRQAAMSLSRAVSMAPENLMYRYNLAITLDKMGETGEAIKLYQQIVEAVRGGASLSIPIRPIEERLTFLRSNRSR